MESKRVALYIRTSEPNSLSAEQQRDGKVFGIEVSAYAKEKGYEIISEITDTGSGLSLDRDGIKEVSLMAHQHVIDSIISPEMKHISRNISQFQLLNGKLKKQGVEIEIPDYDINTKELLMFNMMCKQLQKAEDEANI